MTKITNPTGAVALASAVKAHVVETLSDPPMAAEGSVATPVPENEPLPKTSPNPELGDVVIHRATDKSKQFNGSSDHPAMVTHVWKDKAGRVTCLNLTVIPDCGAPWSATSQTRIHSSVQRDGWFTKGEQQ